MISFFKKLKSLKIGGLIDFKIAVMLLSFLVLVVLAVGFSSQLMSNFGIFQTESLDSQCRAVGFQNFDQVYCEMEVSDLPPNFPFICDLIDEDLIERYREVRESVENEPSCNQIGDEDCTCVMNAYLHQAQSSNQLLQRETEDSVGGIIGGIIGEGEIREQQSVVAELRASIVDYLWGSDETPQEGEEHSETGIDNLGFNSASVQLLRDFSDRHNIEFRRLVAFARAIAKIETNNRPFDSNRNPTSRFECHQFNRNSNVNVPCTLAGNSFSTVTSETDYGAFLRATSVNENLAYSSTSFGMFQVLGSNYRELGFNSPQQLRDKTLSEEGQVELFLRFIESRRDSILAELQRDGEMNYNEIALRYNGARFRENQYHIKLRVAFEEFYDEFTSQMGSSELLAGLNINAPEMSRTIRHTAEVTNSQFASRLRYEVAGKIRNKGLAENLERILFLTAEELVVIVHIYSAGQCPPNDSTCTRRTGSSRHDFGNAADLYITRNGQRICNGHPDFDRFVEVAFRNGIQGGGSSPGYMGNCNMHLDIVGTRLGGGIHWRSTPNFVSALTRGIGQRQATS